MKNQIKKLLFEIKYGHPGWRLLGIPFIPIALIVGLWVVLWTAYELLVDTAIEILEDLQK